MLVQCFSSWPVVYSMKTVGEEIAGWVLLKAGRMEMG